MDSRSSTSTCDTADPSVAAGFAGGGGWESPRAGSTKDASPPPPPAPPPCGFQFGSKDKPPPRLPTNGAGSNLCAAPHRGPRK